jgi:hypothetical protein
MIDLEQDLGVQGLGGGGWALAAEAAKAAIATQLAALSWKII